MTLGLEGYNTVEGRPLKLRDTKDMLSVGNLQYTELPEDSGRQWERLIRSPKL